jgi:SAM-dependent methyltransferase
MARRFCPRLSGHVLDIGCGHRPLARHLNPDVRYVGVDTNADVEPDVLGSVLDLPFADASFDGAMCNEVIEHVPDPARALAEVRRVLRAGGLLYLTAPQTWGLHYEPHDYFRYTQYGLRYLLSQAGFELVEVRRMGGLFSVFFARLIDLFVVSVLFKALDLFRLRRGRYRLAAVLALPLNAVLTPIVSVLDRLDPTNAYGWAVLARAAQPST